jgi:hypothetical protein
MQPFMDLLALDGTLVNVGALNQVQGGLIGMSIAFGRKSLAGSVIGGVAETQVLVHGQPTRSSPGTRAWRSAGRAMRGVGFARMLHPCLHLRKETANRHQEIPSHYSMLVFRRGGCVVLTEDVAAVRWHRPPEPAPDRGKGEGHVVDGIYIIRRPGSLP